MRRGDEVHFARKKDRRKRAALVRKQGGKCYWCGEKIVEPSWFGAAIVRQTAHHIHVMVDSVLKHFLYATIDHEPPLGTFEKPRAGITNLVAACQKCNQARNHQPRQTGCKLCGVPMGKSRAKSCPDCRWYYASRYEMRSERERWWDELLIDHGGEG